MLRQSNYLGGGRDCDMTDDNGVLIHIRSFEDNPAPKGSGLTKTGRKKRSDAGKTRKPSEWMKFVKLVRQQKGVSHQEAMTIASQMKKEGYSMNDLLDNDSLSLYDTVSYIINKFFHF